MQKSVMKIFFILFLVSLSFELSAQDRVLYVNYGNQASSKEGDDDFVQVFLLKVKFTETEKAYLRVFDPECAGVNDIKFEDFNSNFRFSLYGGAGVYGEAIKSSAPSAEEIDRGELIKSLEFSVDAKYDGEWMTFAELGPSMGDQKDGYHYFKLVVRGVSGNDANLYDLFISSTSIDNLSFNGTEIISYNLTFNIPQKVASAVVPFIVPGDTEFLEIYDFDFSQAKYNYVSPFKGDYALKASGDGVWNKNVVFPDQKEFGRMSGVMVGKGRENPNDISVYIRDNKGASLPMSLPVKIFKTNNKPKISRSHYQLSDCYTVVFDAKGTTDADGDRLEYHWYFGDGTSEKGMRAQHRYSEQRPYSATLIVTDNSGQVENSSFENFNVIVNEPPQAVAGDDISTAPNEIIKFSAESSTDRDGKISRYFWEFGDNRTAEGMVVSYQYTRPGVYYPVLRVEDNSGTPCNFDTDTLRVFVNSQPRAAAGEDKIVAAGEVISFDGSQSSDLDGKLSEYSWELGDGNFSKGERITHSYSNSGIYKVILTVTDDAGVSNSQDKDELIVKVNFPPVANAGQNISSAQDEIIYFYGGNSKDQDGFITEYLWDFGDGTKSSGESVSHSYRKPGNYTVTLKVKDNSGTKDSYGSTTIDVRINAKPIASATQDLNVTLAEFKFDGTSSSDPDGNIMKYYWDFGDGKTSTQPAPTHYYTRPGMYRVRLKVTDDTKEQNNEAITDLIVYVNAKPIAEAGEDQISMPMQEIKFSGQNSVDPDGKLISYRWEISDGTIKEGINSSHSFKKPGIYTVRLIVTDDSNQPNAIDFDEFTVYVNSKPVANAGKDIIAAPGDNISFNGTASYDLDNKIAEYQWKFSDGMTYNTAIVNRSFEQTGIYFGVLTIRDNSNADNQISSDTVMIRINAQPVAKAGSNMRECTTILTFDASESGDPDGDPLVYTWNFGDGSESVNGVKVIHDFKKAGTYPVILTVNDGLNLNNSIARTSITIFINEPPVAEAGKDITVCAGDIVVFNAGESKDAEKGLLKYFWDFGDGTTADGINPTKIYKIGGTYQVTLRVQDDSELPCNTDVDHKVITVIESPVAFAGPDMEVCAGTVVKFDGSKSRDNDGVVNSFLWDFGDGTTGGGMSPTHAFEKPGTYNVVLTITGDELGDCDNTDTDELIVVVKAAPVANFTAPVAFGRDMSVSFNAEESYGGGGNITSYKWDFKDGNSAEGKNIEHTFKKEGKYFVQLTIITDSKTECNTATINKLIEINAPPVIATSREITAGVNEMITFDARESKDADGSIVTYEWNFGDGNSGSGMISRHSYSAAGRYSGSLTLKDNSGLGNGVVTEEITILINSTPVADFVIPSSVALNEEFQLDASVSEDADGQKLAYTWDLGDGNTLIGEKIKYKYFTAGIYNITLTVDDNTNLANSRQKVSKKIKVNTRPKAVYPEEIVVCPSQEFVFDGSASFDLDRDSLSFRWELPEEQTLSGKIAKARFTVPGIYDCRLVVDDGSGSSSAIDVRKFKLVVNSAPVISIEDKGELLVGGVYDGYMFDASKSYDSEGDFINYSWDFGDGSKGTGAKIFHKFLKSGIYKVKLTVSDNRNTSCSVNTKIIEIKANDRQPVN
ncbi:MAG: PKD domain-containing protein [Ignavibacteriaceae bacterium]|nr:PKD domain-containing protein [Ignavibacteriaceae bacterium]